MANSNLTVLALLLAGLAVPALMPATADAQGSDPRTVREALRKLPGVWIEGPGYVITYGGTYQRCAERCLRTRRCVMIEFYRPEKKCNLYESRRALKKGGDSDVGIRG